MDRGDSKIPHMKENKPHRQGTAYSKGETRGWDCKGNIYQCPQWINLTINSYVKSKQQGMPNK